jgi:hypothetical protein
MSEVSDAVVVVVSEESGRISVAHTGRLISRLDPGRLRTILGALYFGEEVRTRGFIPRLREALNALAGRQRAQKPL